MSSPLHSALVALLDEQPLTRQFAAREAPLHEPGQFALRSSMLLDPDARVRHAAARRLAEAAACVSSIGAALLEAYEDPMPGVREAALAALASHGPNGAVLLVTRAALEEPVWWVRRAAIYALSALQGERAAPTLRKVLDDPFWRVRHAAVRALLSFDEASIRTVLAQRPDDSERTLGALEYLRRKRGGEGVRSLVEDRSALKKGRAEGRPAQDWDRLRDPDPAVMTARLLDPKFEVPPEVLLEMVQDAHEPLRALVIQRLEQVRDVRVLQAALLWMDEPRIPHAKSTIEAVLGKLGDAAKPLVRVALSELDTEGAAVWALDWIAQTADEEMVGLAKAHLDDGRGPVREAALRAVFAAGERAPELFGAALLDPQPGVRLTAANLLLELGGSVHLRLLCRGSYSSASAKMRRAIAMAAAQLGELALLWEAAADEDPYARAIALRALSSASALEPQQWRAALSDRDPWIRAAVLDPENAPALLREDPDPEVRRAALEVLRGSTDTPEAQQALDSVFSSEDPLLMAQAAKLLPWQNKDALTRLLSMSASAEPALRAAAADALETALQDEEVALPVLLAQLLPELTAPRLIRAALTWSYRLGDADTLERLAKALHNPETLRLGAPQQDEATRHLRDLLCAYDPSELSAHRLLELRPEARAIVPRVPAPQREPKSAPIRKLGRSDVELSVLTVSGAYEPEMEALQTAYYAGVRNFFWEPTYQRLTKLLRQAPQAQVITGSYHADPASIVRDVEHGLRRLGRDSLDVFLLFWVRSSARLSDEAFEQLRALKQQGKIRAFGFSTHERKLACESMEQRDWDVVMTRHNAAHVGAEKTVFQTAARRNIGVITFSNLCYGRMLQRSSMAPQLEPPKPADCYRYSLSQTGVTTTISAPRLTRELQHNLAALREPQLAPELLAPMRAHGARVYEDNKGFNELVRRVPSAPLRAGALLAAMERPEVER